MNTTGEDLEGMVNATDRSRSMDQDLYPEYRLSRDIWRVWLPCLLLLGGAGNIATVCVMRRMKDHNSSHHVFIIALAVCDLSCLYVGTFPRFLLEFFGLDLWAVHSVTCKLSTWLIYSTITMSAWLLTAVTVQRTMAIRWPHKIRVMCTVRRTWTVVAALVSAAFALHSHCPIMLQLSEAKQCVAKSADYLFFIQKVLTWLNLWTSSFAPFAILLVCDVALSLSLFQATSMTVSARPVHTDHHPPSSDSRRDTAWKTSVMVLAISVTFLVLTMPLCVVLVWYNFNIVQISRNPRLMATMKLTHSVTLLLFYTNNAINFLLYCVTGTKFRKEFVQWICCRGRVTTTTTDANRECGQGNSSLNVCSSVNTFTFDYTACSDNTTYMLYSTAGSLYCLYFTTDSGVTYLNLYNRDSTTDDPVSYRFSCLSNKTHSQSAAPPVLHGPPTFLLYTLFSTSLLLLLSQRLFP
ncbi:hypothetical protein ACOMHN_002091 [Nucella lapillus]